ncbi:MAG: three-Cys-motif partner protein TcmP [Candidatus Bathyarchaeia archaeon]
MEIDCRPVLWKIAPHTAAKHTILKRYIEAWAPILSQSGRNKRLVYIDGFAGPGEYEDGEYGSPVVVLNALRNHSLQNNFKSEFVCIFIEKCDERANHLRKVIKEKVEPLPSWIKYDIHVKDFNQYIKELINYLNVEKLSLAPALTFVDPFGWKDLNYNILSDLMKFGKGELLITLMAGFLQRFVWDKAHLPTIRRLFSDDQIKSIKGSDHQELQEKLIMEYFLANLTSKIEEKIGNATKIWHLAFSARNASNVLEYYLIYLTKNCKGFEAMKNAMYNVSSDGSYRFSDFDFDPHQSTLIDYGVEDVWISDASKEVMDYIDKVTRNGTLKIPIREIKDYIICETKWKYKNAILQKLESDKKIIVNISDRRGTTFPDQGFISKR